MVKHYGAQLVVAFAPIPYEAVAADDGNKLIAEKQIERFQNDHPDVAILFL